jgi:hypothetical protein
MPARSKHYRAHVVLFDRREILKMGAVAAAAGTVLPGCDTLSLPEVQLLDELPPILSNEDFYIQSAFGTPDFDPEAHLCRIVDEDGNLLASFDKEFVMGLEAREREHTLQCIGANPRFLFIGNAVWAGLPFAEILEELGVEIPAGTSWMRITGQDEYATGLPVTDLDGTEGADPMWLVWLMNGEDVPLPHGAPFRFLVPGRYGTKNPKWPREIAFVPNEFVGHWESRGWSQLATYQTNGLILSPPTMAVVGSGTIRVIGSAFSGHTQITQVEITTDGGDSWTDATIDYNAEGSDIPPDATDLNSGRHIWTTWSYDWTLDSPGRYEVQIRVTDETGHSSDLDPAGTDRFNGYNAGMAIHVEVT